VCGFHFVSAGLFTSRSFVCVREDSTECVSEAEAVGGAFVLGGLRSVEGPSI
jgi:hypothetical protein